MLHIIDIGTVCVRLRIADRLFAFGSHSESSACFNYNRVIERLASVLGKKKIFLETITIASPATGSMVRDHQDRPLLHWVDPWMRGPEPSLELVTAGDIYKNEGSSDLISHFLKDQKN
jgi:hypothetical protein